MDHATTPVMDAGSRGETAVEAPTAVGPAAGAAALEELLIEEISIDGMCGVY